MVEDTPENALNNTYNEIHAAMGELESENSLSNHNPERKEQIIENTKKQIIEFLEAYNRLNSEKQEQHKEWFDKVQEWAEVLAVETEIS